jgi:hypothetical protein
MLKPLAVTTVGLISVFTVALAWRLIDVTANPQAAPPPFDVERVTERKLMPGGHVLDPAPAGLQPTLSADEAAQTAIDLEARFPNIASRASRFRLHVGIYDTTPPSGDIKSGSLVYVITGDNKVPCPRPGGFGGPGSATPRVNAGAVPTATCEWALTVDARDGSFVGMVFSPAAFCKENLPC